MIDGIRPRTALSAARSASVLAWSCFACCTCRRLLAYLTVGILVGPHAFALLPDSADARYLAEFGIVFLMFSIGLEFSLAKLRAMRRIVLGLGAAQVLLTVAAGW